jgi:hypothetical protein
MKNITHLILIIVTTLILTACGGDPKGTVKNGVLEFDTSVTVGDALDGYDYFKSTSWDTFETSQGRTVVEFNGVMNLDAYEGSSFEGMALTSDMIDKAKDTIKELKLTYEAQFSISKSDDSFEVLYSGIKMTGKSIDNGEDADIDQSDDDRSGLASIYKNKPEMKTWGYLLVLSHN